MNLAQPGHCLHGNIELDQLKSIHGPRIENQGLKPTRAIHQLAAVASIKLTRKTPGPIQRGPPLADGWADRVSEKVILPLPPRLLYLCSRGAPC